MATMTGEIPCKFSRIPTAEELESFRREWLAIYPKIKLLALWIDNKLVYEHPERRSEMG